VKVDQFIRRPVFIKPGKSKTLVGKDLAKGVLVDVNKSNGMAMVRLDDMSKEVAVELRYLVFADSPNSNVSDDISQKTDEWAIIAFTGHGHWAYSGTGWVRDPEQAKSYLKSNAGKAMGQIKRRDPNKLPCSPDKIKAIEFDQATRWLTKFVSKNPDQKDDVWKKPRSKPKSKPVTHSEQEQEQEQEQEHKKQLVDSDSINVDEVMDGLGCLN